MSVWFAVLASSTSLSVAVVFDVTAAFDSLSVVFVAEASVVVELCSGKVPLAKESPSLPPVPAVFSLVSFPLVVFTSESAVLLLYESVEV